MTPRRALVAVCVCMLWASAVPAGQAPAAPATPAPAAPPSDAPTPPPDYTYAPEGRRDPFIRTVGRSPSAIRTPTMRPEGLAGVLVSEVVVRGFLESRGSWVAMAGAPNGRSYTLHAGDRLMDGVVRTITSDSVVFLQQVSDPMSPVKQREVRKSLRGGEQGQ